MTKLKLNRKQVVQLAQVAEHFPQVEWVTLTEERSSSIGPTVTVKFNLFGDADTDIDTTVTITDVSTW